MSEQSTSESAFIERDKAYDKMITFQHKLLYQIISQIGFLNPAESVEIIVKYHNFVNLQNVHFNNLFHNTEKASLNEFNLYIMQGYNYNVYIKQIQDGLLQFNGLMIDYSKPLLTPNFMILTPKDESFPKPNVSFDINTTTPPLHSLLKDIGLLNQKKSTNLSEFKKRKMEIQC
jgi:hypothetical protein